MTIPNPTGRVGSGLLSRVSFTQTAVDRVVVPISALQDVGGKPAPLENRSSPKQTGANSPAPKRTRGTLFVIERDGEQAKVNARSVALGQQIDGKVQIISGLNPGERFVARSGKPLKDGDSVRLSILSAK
jgi:multidrug efflux pump subunit AcrA (membrane-fusion protein)